MAQPSAEIIRRAQRGDEEALTELVKSQHNYIYSIAMGVFRNPEDAADATQEAFIRLFRVLPSFRGETRFTTWLYRVVMNLCYDELRRRKRRPTSVDDAEETMGRLPETAFWADPEQEATQSETQARVRAALWRLDEQYRVALTLYYFQSLKYREIAEIMGLPLNTIKSHIYRGKAQLAELLAEPADIGHDTPLASSRGRPNRSAVPDSHLAFTTNRAV